LESTYLHFGLNATPVRRGFPIRPFHFRLLFTRIMHSPPPCFLFFRVFDLAGPGSLAFTFVWTSCSETFSFSTKMNHVFRAPITLTLFFPFLWRLSFPFPFFFFCSCALFFLVCRLCSLVCRSPSAPPFSPPLLHSFLCVDLFSGPLQISFAPPPPVIRFPWRFLFSHFFVISATPACSRLFFCFSVPPPQRAFLRTQGFFFFFSPPS